MESKVLKIAENCEWVMQNSSHVYVNESKIPEYAEFIWDVYKEQMKHNLFSSEVHYISDDKEDSLAYIFALDSINFGSGYFEKARADHGLNINYYYVAKALKGAFDNQTVNTPEKWMEVSYADLFDIFSFSRGEYEAIDKMLKSFEGALQDTGRHIVENYKGKVCNFIEASDYSAVKIADDLADWKYFKDCSVYKEREIFFLKRAQILPADIDLIYKDYLKDVDKLTMFADNRVPHTLHCDGVLKYNEDLEAKINNREAFKFGSEEEVEMRAGAIHAVELMKHHLVSKGIKVRSVDLDRLLWHRGEDEILFKSKPSHRTETTAY